MKTPIAVTVILNVFVSFSAYSAAVVFHRSVNYPTPVSTKSVPAASTAKREGANDSEDLDVATELINRRVKRVDERIANLKQMLVRLVAPSKDDELSKLTDDERDKMEDEKRASLVVFRKIKKKLASRLHAMAQYKDALGEDKSEAQTYLDLIKQIDKKLEEYRLRLPLEEQVFLKR